MRGQTAVEYTVIIATAAAALITMQIIFQRTVRGGLLIAVDQFHDPQSPPPTSPSQPLIVRTTTQNSNSSEQTVMPGGGSVSRWGQGSESTSN